MAAFCGTHRISDERLEERGGGRRSDPQGSQTRGPDVGGGQMLSGLRQRKEQIPEQFLGNLFIKASLISAYSLQFNFFQKRLTFEQKLFVKLANISKGFFSSQLFVL